MPLFIQGQNQNYIKTLTYKEESGISDVNKAYVGVTYFDGLGRPIQEVTGKRSPSGKDIITHISYDSLGRKTKEYLPYPALTSDFSYQSNAEADVLSYYSTLSTTPGVGPQEITANPYSKSFFDNSPMNRLVKQSYPGNDWQGNETNDNDHTLKFGYYSNTITDSVRVFKAISTLSSTDDNLYDVSLIANGSTFFQGNQLFKTITQDESLTTSVTPTSKLNTTIEFKDKEGRIVLRRSFNSKIVNRAVRVETLDTYFIYDQFGNLSYVLPPLCNGAVSNLDGLAYQYKYDKRNRLVEKKIPGKNWQFIVYDKLDRVVMTGPVAPPFNNMVDNGWLITKYDRCDRPTMTLWMTSASIIDSGIRKVKQQERDIQTIFSESRLSGGSSVTYTYNGLSVTHNYSNLSLPVSGYYIMTINYYDDYNYSGAPNIPAEVEGQEVYYNLTRKPIGQPTGAWARVISTNNSNKSESSYVLYDKNNRIIRSFVLNHETSPGSTQIDSKFDFKGKLLKKVTVQKRTNADPNPISITELFTYSEEGLLITHTHQVNNKPIQLLAKNTYDAVGQLIKKEVGNVEGTPLQVVDYKYSIRGWLTDINSVDDLQRGNQPDDLFAFHINYNNSIENDFNGSIKPLYNGNIAETTWLTAPNEIKRRYGYVYDGLNRMKDAWFQMPDNSLAPEIDIYGEHVSYDKNGNIETLVRTGGLPNTGTPSNVTINTIFDNLTYTYNTSSPNQLTKIVDLSNNNQGFKDGSNSGNDYQYDIYGNLNLDNNKGILNIKYNHLNLPLIIDFGSLGNIKYVYNSQGIKREKQVTVGGVTTTIKYFDGGFQYLKIGSDSDVLQFFPTAEGFVNKDGSNYKYVYNYLDHLGNVRLKYCDSDLDGVINTSEILEENQYYPFGMKHEGYDEYAGSINKYRFNGKEIQEELGLNMYSMDFRQYDSAIGRFVTVDPMAEQKYDVTPFRFGFNSPVLFSDPTGLWEIINGGYTTSDPGEINAFVYSYNRQSSGVKNNKLDIYVSSSNFDFVLSASKREVANTEVILEALYGYSTLKTIELNANDNVNDIQELAQELNKLQTKGFSFASFIIDGHGGYNTNSFRVGDEIVHYNDYKKNTSQLTKYFNNTNIYILACNLGGGKNTIVSSNFVQGLADLWNANVFANRSWSPSGVFDQPLKLGWLGLATSATSETNGRAFAGQWLLAQPGCGTPSIIYNLQISPIRGEMLKVNAVPGVNHKFDDK